MSDLAKEITAVNIEDELKQSYMDYAMSVIVGRALPDARDGLKPVHRRVLFAMNELCNDWNKAYKKSARVVGDVIGKYHPHGDVAIYDSIVRMAQPFSLRYLLVDGQGNFGSVDGDPPAAMRYTEVRMSKLAHMLLADLEKETVDFVPNYDGTEMIPVVLPTRVPNLLVNGSSGIAVGMATNIPPHNLGEIIDATIALIHNSNLTVDELIEFVPGPDFPTAGIISGRAGIIEAYRTGRGRIYVRGRTSVEEDENSGRVSIIIGELPYQVNKARLIERVAELVKGKLLEGIVGLRDESDKDGMRVVIDVRRGDSPDVILNNLYSQTQLQTVFGINMVALVAGRPRVLSLKSLLESFLQHRREVVTRRTLFELKKARERAHLLEGLAIALANIDEVIALIKASPTPQDAKQKLLEKTWPAGFVPKLLETVSLDMTRPESLPAEFGLQGDIYRLTTAQAQAILDLRLHRLTGLEQDKIIEEYRELLIKITELLAILASSTRLMEVIEEELTEIKQQFADKRRTEILNSHQDLDMEDFITDETVVVTLSREGYVKYQPVDTYQAQRRGGRGKAATNLKDEDIIERLLIANTHDTILCFSNKGRVYWLRVFQLPLASRTSRGRPIVNLLPLEEGEAIKAMLPVREYSEDKFVIMATKRGLVKKTVLSAYSRPRPGGIIGLALNEGDDLVAVDITNGDDEIMLFTNSGKVIRFHEAEAREVGRAARGVRGIRMQENQIVVSLIIAKPAGAILTATQKGYGKRTGLDEYRRQGRGGQGVISIQVNTRNGEVISAVHVADNDEIMLISSKGTLVRTRVNEVSVVGRGAQGVRLINLMEGELLVGLERVDELSQGADEDDVLPAGESEGDVNAE